MDYRPLRFITLWSVSMSFGFFVCLSSSLSGLRFLSPLNEGTWFLTCSVIFISLSRIISRSIPAVGKWQNFWISYDEVPFHCVWIPHLVHADTCQRTLVVSVSWPPGIVLKCTFGYIQVDWEMCLDLRWIPRREIAEPYVHSIKCLPNFHSIFHSGYSSLLFSVVHKCSFFSTSSPVLPVTSLVDGCHSARCKLILPCGFCFPFSNS